MIRFINIYLLLLVTILSLLLVIFSPLIDSTNQGIEGELNFGKFTIQDSSIGDSLKVDYLSCKSLYDCMQKGYVHGNDSIQYLMYEKLTSLQIDSVASLDTLNQLMEYAEKLQVLSDLDPDNSIVYSSVSDHWMNFISTSLSIQQKQETSLKYSFKYQSLVNRLNKYNHYPSVLNSSTEKVISNILNSRFSYLLNRIWLRTSMITKVILSLLLIFGSYIVYLGIKEFINQLKVKLK